MTIKSIKIKNLLSFSEYYLEEIKELNCIVGKNNVGKSNFLKLLQFFYDCLEERRVLPPLLHNNYDTVGSITVVYDMSRIFNIVTNPKEQKKNPLFKNIYNLFFKKIKDPLFTIELTVNANNSTKWSVRNIELRRILHYLYPLFTIDTRELELYDWSDLWEKISKLKSFKAHYATQKDIVEFFDKHIALNQGAYTKYIENIEKIFNQNPISINKYTTREKLLNYIKVGVTGHSFSIFNEDVNIQSYGTNSSSYIQLFLSIMINLTRSSYISPVVYIDEPEIGLHPKKSEELILNLYEIYDPLFNKATPLPRIFISTHSPNILKYTVKLFPKIQQTLHFTKNSGKSTPTEMRVLNSTSYPNKFLNVFSDNEARLLFSNFILFVEGETEIELFGHRALTSKFPFLKKIDLYASSDNVVLGNLVDTISRSKIPFLILYDLDKVLDFNISSGKYSFKDQGLIFRLKSLLQSGASLGYHSPKVLKYNRLVKKLSSLPSKNTVYSSLTMLSEISGEQFEDYLSAIIDFSWLHNVKINKSTIEEALICNESYNIFVDWLKTVPPNFVKAANATDVENILQYLISNFSLTQETLVVYLRLLFNGKSRSMVSFNHLYSTKHILYQSTTSKAIMDYLRLNLGNKVGKTDGWITEFLDYAIPILSTRGRGFQFEFTKTFPELDAIIKAVKV